MHYLYIIERSDGKCYVGVTSNPSRRLKEHIYNGNAHLKGRNDLEMSIILSGTREEVYALEPEYIHALGAELNIHAGGCFPHNLPDRSGTNNSRAKFTEQEIIDIRTAYASGTRQDDLAIKYNRPKVTISKIVTGDTWKNTGGPISKPAQGNRPNSLSQKTKDEILKLTVEGLTGPQIAKQLGIGATTVYRYRKK